MDGQLADELRARNLQLSTVTSYRDIPAATARGPRAVLLPYTAELRKEFLAIADDVLNSGALFLILINDSKERVPAAEVVQSALRIQIESTKHDSVRILEKQDKATVAETCARHDSGRDRSDVLAINFGTPPVTLSGSEQMLLRRAFAGYQTVRINELAGGFSECRLLRVQATDSSGLDCAPYSIKIGPHDVIQREIATTRDFVADRIPFPHHPSIVHDRCVVGAASRVLVSRLVDHADRLDAFIDGALTDQEVERSISLIFESALRIWRSQGPSAHLSLVSHYREAPVKAIPDPSRLEKAWLEARASNPVIVAPADLIAEAEQRVQRRPVQLCLAHGDLQVRNVFSRRHQRTTRLTDVVLIDFEAAGVHSPRSRDLATLDVSVALDALGRLPRLRLAEAAKLYSRDILNLDAVPDAGRRYVAVRSVRAQALREGIDREEYLASLVAYLMRYAKFIRTQGTEMCATAYQLAWQLVNYL